MEYVCSYSDNEGMDLPEAQYSSEAQSQPSSGGSGRANSDDHDKIIAALCKVGCSPVTWNDLESKGKPARDATIAVPLLTRVFPIERHLKDKKKEVYIDRNFADVFRHVCERSGWLENAGYPRTTVKRRGETVDCVQVSGPPGSGKSLATFAALRYLTGVTGHLIIYSSLRTAGQARLPSLAVLVGHRIYSVLMIASRSDQEMTALVESLLMDLKPHGVFLDGIHGQLLTGFAVKLRDLADDLLEYSPYTARTTFIGVTTSARPIQPLFLGVAPCISSPWLLEDYLSYAEALQGRFTSDQLYHLGCADGAGLDEVLAAMRAKYLVAGHCCCFMFDRTTSEVTTALQVACDELRWDRSGRSAHQVAATSTVLLVAISDRYVPVSAAAAELLARRVSSFGAGCVCAD